MNLAERTAPDIYIGIFEAEEDSLPKERLQKAVRDYLELLDAEGKKRILQRAGTPETEKEEHSRLQELWRIARTESGKPYFPNCPGLHFSISHSGRYWACAVSEAEVGLDLQQYVKRRLETREEAAKRFQKMAHRFFHPVESAYVDGDPYTRFFQVWAAREAYVKYTGQGIDKHFSKHCVIPGGKAENFPEPNGDQTTGSAALQTVLQTVGQAGRQTVWHAMGCEFWACDWEAEYTLCVCRRLDEQIRQDVGEDMKQGGLSVYTMKYARLFHV